MDGFIKLFQDSYVLKTPFAGVWSGVFLITGKTNILIDSGASGEVVDTCVVPALAGLGLKTSDIAYLINTHSHGDHAGGNRRFLELSGRTTLAAFRPAADKIRDPLKYGRAIRLKYPENSPPPQSVLDGCTPGLVLDGEDMLADRLKLIPTPGHDSECVSLFDLQTGALYTGDALQGFGMVGAEGASGLAFIQYLSDYLSSLETVRRLDPACLVASHDYIPFGFLAADKREVSAVLDVCLFAVSSYRVLVRRELEAGCRNTAAIAKKVIKSFGAAVPEKLFMAMYTVDELIREYDLF